MLKPGPPHTINITSPNIYHQLTVFCKAHSTMDNNLWCPAIKREHLQTVVRCPTGICFRGAQKANALGQTNKGVENQWFPCEDDLQTVSFCSHRTVCLLEGPHFWRIPGREKTQPISDQRHAGTDRFPWPSMPRTATISFLDCLIRALPFE